MISLLIFSKDRAAQAHLLLESISLNSPLDLFQIFLLYKSSSDDYNRGYNLLQKRFPNVKHIEQSNFKADVENWLSKQQEFVAFGVDDNVMYRDIKQQCDCLNQVLPLHLNEVFSFRLGLNTIVQTHRENVFQPPLNRYTNKGGFIFWMPQDYNPLYNYGYPMSVDFHVFNQKLMLELVRQIDYNTPTSLEGGLFKFANQIQLMSAFTQSAIVNIPCNNVGGCTQVNNCSISCEELNSAYLMGKVLDISVFDDYNCVGCHQECNLKLRDY